MNPDSSTAELDRIIDRFEDAWQDGGRPAIEDFLPPEAAPALLLELVHVELERRLKAGEPARVEEYLRRYPPLAADPQAVAGLVAAEFRLRRAADPGLTADEFGRRFPDHAAALETLFVPPPPPATCAYRTDAPTPAHGSPPVPDGQPVRTTATYRVLRHHARGGLGEILLARDADLDRDVALKLLQRGQAQHAASRQRFLWEAAVTGQLEHPGVVPLYGLGQAADGTPVYVMRFIRGETLHDALTRFHQARRDGPLASVPFRQLLSRFVSVCNTVAYAHSRGVLHCDLKPANVMLGPYGETLVVDWGLARSVDGSHPGAVAAPGLIAGTPAFMSPEQAGGAADLGPASDLYGLGATLYALLTGRPPYPDATAGVLDRVRRGDFPPPRQVRPDVPRALEAICLKAMAPRPPDRYPDALALGRDLEQWLAGEPTGAYREPARDRLRRWLVRHAAPVTGVGVTLVAFAVLTAVTAFFLAANDRERAAKELAELRSAEDRRVLDQAERGNYFHRITWADREWLANNAPGAEQRLNECTNPAISHWEWHYLKRRCQGAALTLQGHGAVVWSVAWSPDGRRLASASLDGTAKVWDAAAGRPLLTFARHRGPVWGVAWSPDGHTLATGGEDGQIRLWDAATGAERQALPLPAGEVRGLAFSPDGRLLAAACRPGMNALRRDAAAEAARVWEVGGGRELWTFPVRGGVQGVAFRGDGRRLAAAGLDGVVRTWDLGTGQEVRKLAGPPLDRGNANYAHGVAYSLDGRWLAAAYVDGRVRVWEADTGKGLHTLQGHTDAAWGVAFSPDGKYLASASDDMSIRLWDPATGRPLLVLLGHHRGIANVAFSPDGRRLASACDDQTVKVWDPAHRREVQLLAEHAGPVNGLAFRPDGTRLASAGADATVKVWDPATGQVLRSLKTPEEILAVAYSPDGRQLAAVGAGGTVTVLDAATGAALTTLHGPVGGVAAVAFDGRGRLAGAGEDGAVRVWDLATGREVLTLRGHTGKVHALIFGHDGGRLYSGGEDKTVRAWDAATGEGRHVWAGHTTAVLRLALSPDGATLASGGASPWGPFQREPGEIRLWDLAGGRDPLAFHGHLAGVTGLAFSPDGQRLFSGSEDGTVKIWEPATGREILTLADHQIPVTAVAFGAGGHLASAGRNGAILVRLGKADGER